jgi:hypothetical protein
LALFGCRLNLNWALFFSFRILKELCETVIWLLFSAVSWKELQNGVGLRPARIDRWEKDRLFGKRSWKMAERVGYSGESRLLGIGWIGPNRIWIRICSTINEFKRGMDVVFFFLGETPYYLVYPTNYFDPLESSRTHRRRKILRASLAHSKKVWELTEQRLISKVLRLANVLRLKNVCRLAGTLRDVKLWDPSAILITTSDSISFSHCSTVQGERKSHCNLGMISPTVDSDVALSKPRQSFLVPQLPDA